MLQVSPASFPIISLWVELGLGSGSRQGGDICIQTNSLIGVSLTNPQAGDIESGGFIFRNG